MQQIEDIEKISSPFTRTVLTIGNFDGVHLGHQYLFHKVLETAQQINGTAVAMTFEPHPMKVIKPDGCPFPLITLYEQKVELLSQMGLDILIVIPFTDVFSQISARHFVQNILVKRIGVKSIVIGNDYCFGKNREGNINLLKKFGNEFGFSVKIVSWKTFDNIPQTRISSTAIRKAVMSGNLKLAKQMLGRYYQVQGTVQRGRNRGGAEVGFPTANLNLYDELKPLNGVYAVSVLYQNKNYPAVANIGYAPTFDDKEYTLEIHLIDFSANLYDQTIRVNFIERLRGEKKFNSIEALSKQIKYDIQNAKMIFDTI